MDPSTSLSISVIIPTRNEEDVIGDCLSAVFDQSLKPTEVIVVDGLSTDNTVDIASRFPVKILKESEPTSLPNARNIGVENSQSDVVFIMDADIILHKDCIRTALKYFRDPQVIGVIPSEHNTAHSKLEQIQIDWFKGSANSVRPGIGISVFAEFLRRSAFEKVKFDSKLGYGEDDDFQRRLRESIVDSGKIVRSPESIISCHYCHTLKELRSQYGWYGRTFKKYLGKGHFSKPLLNLGSLLAPTFVIIFGLVSLFFPIMIIFFILTAALVIARDLLVCIRSRRPTFFEFMVFEFLRSFFFIRGLLQGLISKKRGR